MCCFAQKHTITGTVYDEANNVLANANVIVKDSKKGTITNEKGQFSMDLEKISALEISYLGFETRSIVISDEKEVSITLKSSAEALDAAIIVSEDYNRTIGCGFDYKVIYMTETYIPMKTTLFPNPSANGMFQLQLNGDFTTLTVEVYTMNGQLVQSNTHSNLSKIPAIDLSKQPKGLYLIRMNADGLPLETKKVIRS